MMADDILSFQDPENLLEKQFILSPDTEASGLFEVIAYCKGKDRVIKYDIQFEDIPDPIQVDTEEIMGMLKESLYVQ